MCSSVLPSVHAQGLAANARFGKGGVNLCFHLLLVKITALTCIFSILNSFFNSVFALHFVQGFLSAGLLRNRI